MKAPTDCLNAGWGPSVWGRVLGQQIDNHYRAFADPRASGQLLGFQSGIDIWRGEWLPGHRDAAGIYVGYANANVDVSGLVTNEAATGYVLRHTGGLNLDAWSGAAYWTHYGPGDWYLDAVAQATQYQGSASTQFARLDTSGFGFLTSLETGYPVQLPMFGPGFVLEPQAQIVWQRVSFDDANDGLGTVALGTTSGDERADRPARPMDHRQRQRAGVAALCARQSVARLGGAGDDDVFRRRSGAAAGAGHAPATGRWPEREDECQSQLLRQCRLPVRRRQHRRRQARRRPRSRWCAIYVVKLTGG